MKQACMVVHSVYPNDERVRREAEILLDAGWALDVICLEEKNEPATETVNGARVYRLPIQRNRDRGVLGYGVEYLSFFVLASARLALLQARHRYDLVQAHNMPDFLVFTTILPKLMGARAVLDIHDLVPELYSQKFGGKPNHPFVQLTRWVERLSTSFADHVITAGEPFRQRLIERGVPADKVTVVMNTADPRLFHLLPENQRVAGAAGHFKLIYHGGLFQRYGLDLAIKAVDRLRDELPDVVLDIYGQGDAKPELRRLVQELRLEDRVVVHGHVPTARIPGLIRDADLGVVPYRKNPFTDLLYPTKSFEYLAVGVPVIMSATQAVTDLFQNLPDAFFEPDDVEDLVRHIRALHDDPARRAALLSASQTICAPYAWSVQRETYLTLANQLTGADDRDAIEAPPAATPAGRI